MKLSMLLKGVNNTIIFGNINKNITKLNQNSNFAKKNSLFFCINGTKTNGELYIWEAINNGATAVVLDKTALANIDFCGFVQSMLKNIKSKKNGKCKKQCFDIFNITLNGYDNLKRITYIFVDDVRKAMAKISSNFFGEPQKKLKIVGITGTNGKTSCSYILADLLKQFGKRVGVIGTSGIFVAGKKYEASLTTPDSIELFEIFAKMVKRKVEFCVMEVSAHAIYFNKIFGIKFSAKALTNVKCDHLDFFKTQKKYQSVKKSFFKNNDSAVINIDDEIGRQIQNKTIHSKQNTTKNNTNILCFGNDTFADLFFYDVHLSLGETHFKLKYKNQVFDVQTHLTGLFNVCNVVLSIGVLIKLGFDIQSIITFLPSIKNISGRFDVVFKDENLSIIIDYAHTTDSLKNFLKTACKVSTKSKIIVLGCPGERDSIKRFEMGKLASEFCDIVILTSDNPASENPRRIIFEMLCGAEQAKRKNKVFLVENREKAIKKAIFLAKKHKNCEILLVGKGTENYQIVGKRKVKYSDYSVVKKLLT